MNQPSIRDALAAMALVAAVSVAGPATAGKGDDTLNVAIGSEIATLDFYYGSDRPNLIMSQHLYDTLIYKDQETGKFVPALAEGFEYLDDKTIEFTIRKGVKFHDGSVLNAEDVAYTLNKVSQPDSGVTYQLAVNWIEKAEVIGTDKVRLHMNRTYPVALEWLGGFLPIYPKDYYEKVGKEGMAVKPVGTGPYRIVEVTPGTSWKLERFEDHYAASPKGNAIGKINIRVIPEANTQFTELFTGKLDFIWRFTPDQADRLAGRSGIVIKSKPIMRVVFMQPNVSADTPIKDVQVRKAIIHAINRKQIAAAFVGDGGRVIDTACNPVQFGCYTNVTAYDYDPAKAKALLKEAGYVDGLSLKVLTQQAPPTARSIAEAIIANLAEVGITAEVEMQLWASAREKWISGGYDLLLMSWGSWGIGDVAMFTSEFFGGGDVDKVQSDELIGYIKQGDGSIDRSVREASYKRVIEEVASNAFWVPLWTYSVNYAISEDLDFEISPDEITRFFDARWK